MSHNLGSPTADSAHAPAVLDLWAYVQDERAKYPRLWRLSVRVHTRPFRLAFPELTLADLPNVGHLIAEDIIRRIQARSDPGSPSWLFQLQFPMIPAERTIPCFEGQWRGWFSLGLPERVN